MFRNITQARIEQANDGSITVRLIGVETFPQLDAQGDAISPATTGATVELTLDDPAITAQFASAVGAAAQSVATRDNVRVRLNGSATEYTKAAP